MGRKTKKAPVTRKGISLTVWALSAAVLIVVVVAGAVYVQRHKRNREALRTVDIVKIETSKGLIVMEVYPKLMPITVTNFEDLAKSGFYDGLIWHRVENWVIQTGDPQGTGYGGSSKTIKLEVSRELKNLRGAVGMARSDAPNSASSQFYALKKDARWLDGDYAVFGKVVTGMDVVDKIEAGDKMLKVAVEPGKEGQPGAAPK